MIYPKALWVSPLLFIVFISAQAFLRFLHSRPDLLPKMLLYTDILGDDEMFSDAFPMYILTSLMGCSNRFSSFPRSKEVDDIVYEVDCQMITVKDGDVDIGMSQFRVVPRVRLLNKCIIRCQPLRGRTGGGSRGGCPASQQCCPLFPPAVNLLRQKDLPHVPQGPAGHLSVDRPILMHWFVGLHEGR